MAVWLGGLVSTLSPSGVSVFLVEVPFRGERSVV